MTTPSPPAPPADDGEATQLDIEPAAISTADYLCNFTEDDFATFSGTADAAAAVVGYGLGAYGSGAYGR